MKFSERLHRFFARCRTRASINCIKVRLVARFLLWHTCWCSLIVGAIILTVGIVLRTKLIETSNVRLLEGSGLFFIVIGIFLIVLSPLIAIYELSNLKQLNQATELNSSHLGDGHVNSNETIPRMDSRGDLPTYDEITKSNRSARYPRMLDVDTLSNSSQAPMPPAYNEIARSESMLSNASQKSIKSEEVVATIAPSSHTDANMYIRRST